MDPFSSVIHLFYLYRHSLSTRIKGQLLSLTHLSCSSTLKWMNNPNKMSDLSTISVVFTLLNGILNTCKLMRITRNKRRGKNAQSHLPMNWLRDLVKYWHLARLLILVWVITRANHRKIGPERAGIPQVLVFRSQHQEKWRILMIYDS